MTKSEKLNALTRLAIIVSIGMYVMKYKQWFNFLLLSLFLIVILNYATQTESFRTINLKIDDVVDQKTDISSETTTRVEDFDDDDFETLENPDVGATIEDFTIVPTYTGTDFQQTVVAPTFAEEWQVPPPAYDLYTQVPYPGAASDTFEAPLKPQSYPYGQYLTRTNLLPSDEYYANLGCGGPRTAREYINSTFLRHDLARRENMMRIYKKKLNRRFRGNTQDSFSPFASY